MTGIAYPVVNGATYAWSNVSIYFLNNISMKCVAIDYKKMQVKENQYAAGIDVQGVGYGNKTYTASITLWLEDVAELINIAPNGDILEIPAFDIVVSYGSIVKFRRDILKNVEFKECNISNKQGDLKVEITLPLQLTGIDFGSNI